MQLPKNLAEATEWLNVHFPTAYTWNYDTQRQDLRTLYEKAKKGQWNGQTDLAWKTDVDPEGEHMPDAQIAIYGTDMWKKLTPREIQQLRHEFQSWTLSQFLHGEQGALLATAQLVDAVPWIDAKYYAATQVMDEARHVEVYEKYLREKLELTYPINPELKKLLDLILTDSRWDMKYLGMQIMVEGLALSAFKFINTFSKEPLIRDLTRHVMDDEARHVAFGVMSLRGLYQDMTEKEFKERQDFAYEACVLMRDRFTGKEVWEKMGFPVDRCVELSLNAPAMREFRKMLFANIVPNLKRIGLLTGKLRDRFADLDILKFENFEPSA
ncbi:MAG: ferritin-like domain-containing protein [Bdellovibrionota bacterium]